LILFTLFVLVGQAACNALRETPPTPQLSLPTIQVTADQVAQSMQQDDFFSTYGLNTLIISGTVSSIDRQANDLIVELKTSVPTRVFCELGNQSSSVHVGDAITVRSVLPNRDVTRRGSDMLIKNCTLL
jgi:hypothetical protein